jgi:hypothetical protein
MVYYTLYAVFVNSFSSVRPGDSLYVVKILMYVLAARIQRILFPGMRGARKCPLGEPRGHFVILRGCFRSDR